jgi:hypothetical protein
MRRRFEAALVGLIGLACAAFAAVLVRGPAREEETAMANAQIGWGRWWSRGQEQGPTLLGQDQVLRLPDWPEGSRVRVEAGLVVVTREGDAQDHVLEAGAELPVPGRGLAVVWALEPSRIVVRRGTMQDAGRCVLAASEAPAAAR